MKKFIAAAFIAAGLVGSVAATTAPAQADTSWYCKTC